MQCLVIGSCKKDRPKKETPISIDNDPIDKSKGIAQLIEEAYQRIDKSSVPYPYNEAKASRLKAQLDIMPLGPQSIETWFSYSTQLLYAGLSTRCIIEVEKLDAFINEQKIPKDPQSALTIKKLKALAYMRMGEQENCFARQPDACLIPTTIDNQYSKRPSVRQAINIYKEILATDAEDSEAIWLLNLGYMVLGEYPGKVPKDFLIPLSRFESDIPFSKFNNVAKDAGVDELGLAGGVAFDDFNNDGYADIITGTTDPAKTLKFFVNNRDGTFIDNSVVSGLDKITGGLNLVHADYNNDGYLDLFVLRGAWDGVNGQVPNSLIRNNGNGSFTDVTMTSGVFSQRPTQSATWSDINRDGWIDLFIVNESSRNNVHPCELYISNQDGTFMEVAAQVGLAKNTGFYKGCTIGDVNNDGWPDIFISNYNGNNLLYLHNGHDDLAQMSFIESSQVARVRRPARSFSTWMFDYNNDGLLDIFVSSYGDLNRKRLDAVVDCYLDDCMAELCPHLYVNQGDGTFENKAKEAGLSEINLTMGCSYADINMDGFLDIFLATGDPDYSTVVPNKVYLNSKSGQFYDVTSNGGFGHIQKGHAVGMADFDHDGDEDIYCVLGGVYEGDVFRNSLYHNPMEERQWLALDLEGTRSNHCSIGTRIRLSILNKEGELELFYRVIGAGTSFGGNSLIEIFGFENIEKIESIQIQWTHKNSVVQTFSNIPLNTLIKIVEGKADFEIVDY